MVLTRQEKERLVVDLYNQGKNTRYIAQVLHISFRDIGEIIDREVKRNEAKEQQQQQLSLVSRAYTLFSEGKSPVAVAIDLNLRQPQVTELYNEYLKLDNLHSLNQAYKELDGKIEPFLKLCRLIKSAGMNTQHVIKLLAVANNDIPSVEYKLQELKVEEASLQADNRNSARTFQELCSHITTTRNTLKQYELSCKERGLEIARLQIQKIRLEALVNHFKNNSEEYLKIRNTVEAEVLSVLSDGKELLRLASLSLTESMRNNPDKYSFLIYHNTSPSTVDYNNQYYAACYMYGQQQYPPLQDYNNEDYTTMLLEEAEKLYNKLAKEWVDKIITEYAFSISSSSSLPSLPLLAHSDEQKDNDNEDLNTSG